MQKIYSANIHPLRILQKANPNPFFAPGSTFSLIFNWAGKSAHHKMTIESRGEHGTGIYSLVLKPEDLEWVVSHYFSTCQKIVLSPFPVSFQERGKNSSVFNFKINRERKEIWLDILKSTGVMFTSSSWNQCIMFFTNKGVPRSIRWTTDIHSLHQGR